MRSAMLGHWRSALPVLCAAWAAGWLWGDPVAQSVVVPLVLVGTLIGVRRPLPGALIVLVAQFATVAMGLPGDTPAVLLAGMTVTFLLGREAPIAVGAVVVSGYLVAVWLSEMPLAGHVIGLTFQSAIWILGVAVARADRAAVAAHIHTMALKGSDPETQVEQIVAAERRRMELDVLETLRQSVAGIRTVVDAAGGRVEARALRTVRGLAQATIADLRTLLVSLRSPSEVAEAVVGESFATSRWRRWRQDVAVMLVVAAVGATDAVVQGPMFPDADVLSWAPLAVVLVLPWRRTATSAACLAATVPFVAAHIAGADLIFGLAALLAFGLLSWSAAAESDRKAWVACAVLFVTVVLAPTHQATLYPLVTGSVFVFTAVTSYLWHRRVRDREQETLLAQEYEAAVWARVEPVLVDVRRALARELHDAVSGMVGVVAVHAEAAAALAGTDPGRAQQSMGIVVDAASRAAVELERLRKVLHDAVPEGPTPWSRVSADAEALGLSVEARIDTTVNDLNAATAAYHVVSEALANAAKYAPGSRVTVGIRRIKGDLCVSVVDDGGTPRSDLPTGTGFGLLSQAERVERLGGRLWAAPAGGGFAVRARIPLPMSTAEDLPVGAAADPLRSLEVRQ